MDDIADKISELLNDPEGMDRIRRMAQSVLGQEKPQPKADSAGISALADGVDLTRLIPVISRLKSTEDDNRVALLNALRPHLSEERQQRLDRAVKLLKISAVLPLLQESGIFNF